MKSSVLLTLGLALALARAQAQTGTANLSIQVDQPGALISSNLFGAFFEEINYAGDGGLYGEMVRNRCFNNSANPDYWTLVTQGAAVGQIAIDSSRPLNANDLQSLRLTLQSGAGSAGAANSGYWGLALQAGSNYDLSFYACAAGGFTGPLNARLESADGSQLYAQTSFGGLAANWQRFASALAPSATATNARLVVSIAQPATVWLNVVSLFPRATFHGRTNGLRLDLANMLQDLRPSFLRYPGGNFIEGQSLATAVRWKTTVGDIALRPGHLNDSWGYWSTDGFGLHEFLQFCEDLGTEPLYGINCGLALGYNGSANNTVPLDQMGPWVQDALDLIQYANGPTNTTWGALRAANGHPAPFHLKYLEIGNENGGSYYNDRYALFYDAVKSNYPDVHLIANVWGGVPSSRPLEIQDEHYYSSPATFISYATKYDGYSRSGPRVFVGEYAVTSGYGTLGNLAAALGEAAFMTGLERNSDVVQLASYAPLFANVNGIQWRPDLIYYDGSRVIGTPSYYVQKLFSQNRGDVVLPTAVAITSAPTNPPPRGAIGVGAWSTSVQYSNIVVTSNGVTLYQSDFVNNGANGWRVYNGAWSANAGLYQQTAIAADCRSTRGDTNWANYTISLRARKVSGNEGFLILFNWLDDNNWTWWNIGGWGNTKHAIEQNLGSTRPLISPQVAGSVQINQWYDISVVLTGQRIQCYLNSNLIHDITYPAPAGGVFASSSYARSTGEVIVKAVNPYTAPMSTTFSLKGLGSIAPNASLVQLTGASSASENSLAAPTNVVPVPSTIANAGTNFTLNLPAHSLSVLRLRASGINSYTNLVLQFPSPITNALMVPSSVWGQKSGMWVNLTANSNHAITYASEDTNVAVVDVNGIITGIGSGTTSIIAGYPALGLSARRSLQVVYQPATLAHRYSFSETSGAQAADSIGGPRWTGTLPRSGSFGGGQLALAANLQQYIELPAGILSNYSQVSIETWVTFPSQLPVNCFFFGFGNAIGNTGYNYIFCAPRDGRAAITSGNYTSEQNAYTGVDFSYRTNLHLTFVFNPPGRRLAIYTNGVLAALNSSIAIGFNSVSNLYSWIGRSLYSGDPYPDLILDEFRIYNGALQATDIAATHALGPGQLLSAASPPLAIFASAGGLTLSWPLPFAGYNVFAATNLADGRWSVVTTSPQIVGDQWRVNLPATNAEQYYRLQK